MYRSKGERGRVGDGQIRVPRYVHRSGDPPLCVPGHSHMKLMLTFIHLFLLSYYILYIDTP